jgi:hypothetical protein
MDAFGRLAVTVECQGSVFVHRTVRSAGEIVLAGTDRTKNASNRVNVERHAVV